MSVLDHQKKLASQSGHGLFLCFFDERRGHVVLYAYPHHLLEDKMEKKIISIHSIWWLKPEEGKNNTLDEEEGVHAPPEHVDLELAGRIYAAVKFWVKTSRKKRRSGMTGKLADEKFVLIARSPSVLSFISDEILDLAYDRIRSEIGDKLNYLVLQNLSLIDGELPEGFMKEEVEQLAQEVIKSLDEMCMGLVPTKSTSLFGQEAESRELSFKEQMSISILNEQLSPKLPVWSPLKVRRFTIGSDKTAGTTGVSDADTAKVKNTAELFSFTGHSISSLDGKVAFTVTNGSKDVIANPAVKVTETRGLFDVNTWEINLPAWKAGEKLTFKVPISDLTQKDGNYVITITEAGEQLWVKKIAFADLKSTK